MRESKFIRLKRFESSDLQGPQKTIRKKRHQCGNFCIPKIKLPERKMTENQIGISDSRMLEDNKPVTSMFYRKRILNWE